MSQEALKIPIISSSFYQNDNSTDVSTKNKREFLYNQGSFKYAKKVSKIPKFSEVRHVFEEEMRTGEESKAIKKNSFFKIRAPKVKFIEDSYRASPDTAKNVEFQDLKAKLKEIFKRK